MDTSMIRDAREAKTIYLSNEVGRCMNSLLTAGFATTTEAEVAGAFNRAGYVVLLKAEFRYGIRFPHTTRSE